VEAAFARLIRPVRRSSGDERNQARVRLLKLFETLGNGDERVLEARRDL
jgi:putative thioredoxin